MGKSVVPSESVMVQHTTLSAIVGSTQNCAQHIEAQLIESNPCKVITSMWQIFFRIDYSAVAHFLNQLLGAAHILRQPK